MEELDLIESEDVREKYIDRVDVLEKVKNLLLLPDIEMATTQQVADFYEVDIEAIRWHIRNNRDELESDGYHVWKNKDFRSEYNSILKINNFQGGFIVNFSDGSSIKSSNKGTSLFPRRAILRVGMLLRDSAVAKEVRTQLLNIEEKTTNEQKIEEITKEQQMVLNIVFAKDEIETANATRELIQYKDRYIDKLQNKVDVLVNGILRWNDRSAINHMVRQIAAKVFDCNFTKAWEKVYAHMLYKYNIGVSMRKKNSGLKNPTIFDVLDKDEMKYLVQSCFSLCEMYGISTEDILMEKEK